KRGPQLSHTEKLMEVSQAMMERQKVKTEMLRPVDYKIAFGIDPDMRKKGWEQDDWPELSKKVLAADILVVGTPIWLGHKSSVCTQFIERLYGLSGELNDKGQFLYYGRVGGCVVTGNEDGIKYCAMNILYSLQHVGYLIPPQADAG